MADDPRIKWELANLFGILVDEEKDAWHSGHVSDVLELDEGNAGLLVATQTGGVWVIDTNGSSLALSNPWDTPDVNCLAAGPDGPRHFFAGCTDGVIYETDATATVPLLEWKPVDPPLPKGAGNVNSLAVIRHHRRIIAACDKGLFWSDIPPSAVPRSQYQWKKAIQNNTSTKGFNSVTIGSFSGNTEFPGQEDLSLVSVVAGGLKAGVFIGFWTDHETLIVDRARLVDDQGANWTDWWWTPPTTGASSVAVCERHPDQLYAACAYSDGRLKMVVRSEDGGKRWLFTGFDVLDVPPGQADIRIQAGDQGNPWNNCIGVMPSIPDMVAFGWQHGVFLSRDKGKTWKLISNDPHLHDDVHAVRFKPTTVDEVHFLYIGSDGGLAQVDLDAFGAGTLAARSNYNRLLPALQCYSTFPTRQFYGSLSASHSSVTKGWVSTGVQDNGNIYSDFGAGSPWVQVDGGDGGWNGFLEDGGLIRNITDTENGKAIARSAQLVGTRLADTGVPPLPGLPPGDQNGLNGFVGDVVKRPRFRNEQGQFMYMVAGQGADVYGLFPDGDQPGTYHWEFLGTLPKGKVSGIGSHTGKTVFVGTNRGSIFALDSAQGSFLKLPVVLPNPGINKRQSGGNPNRIVTLSDTDAFATLNSTNLELSYVLRLDGLKWTPTASLGLPADECFYGIEGFFQEDRRVLFVATDDRVYMSEDGGDNWVQASGGLPRRPHSADLRAFIDGDESWLYLSTFGRSVWRTRLYGAHLE